jgi:5-methyltetrahydropteroyltriglutamate--homocysteine methyltransferase
MPISHNLGFPPLGAGRELKRATEGYWSGKVTLANLLKTGAELRARHWRLQQEAGIDLIPSNDFSYYDRMLDTCALVGAVPKRYGWNGGPVDLDTYFAMARGVQAAGRPPAGPGRDRDGDDEVVRHELPLHRARVRAGASVPAVVLEAGR